MRTEIDGYNGVYRQFMNVRDTEHSIQAILSWWTGQYINDDERGIRESRYVETLYDAAGIVKRGIRIEIVSVKNVDYVNPDFLDSLFTEGVQYELVVRSALRNARRNIGQNVISRNSRSIGQVVGRSFSSGTVSKPTISQADLMAILGVS